MRRNPALALALLLVTGAALAADTPLRPEQARSAMGLKLGAWQTRYRVADMKAEMPPRVDAAERDRLVVESRAKLGRAAIRNECLQDQPGRLSLPGLSPPMACDYSRLEARDGRFEIRSLCRDPDGATLEATVKGRYGPEHITARSDVTSSVEGIRVRIKMDSDSRFTGQCPPPPAIPTPPEKGD